MLLPMLAVGKDLHPKHLDDSDWPTFDIPPAPESCTLDVRHGIDWGVATSAYQVEGAWNEDGKGPSIWDTFVRQPDIVFENQTGDVAVDHYHRVSEDVALIKRLGADKYRLSLAWTRIVPSGERGSPINMAGIAFYKRLLLELHAAGITPAVTLFHWDLPQGIQDKYGGFWSPEFQEDFLYYADVVFAHLGHLVKDWMTFNEPISICDLGYGIAVFAPGLNGSDPGKYKCGHNLLLAHGKAVQHYRAKYGWQGGRVGMALDGKWGFPYNESSPADVAAAEAWMQFQYGWMADPVYFGDYPPLMRATQGDWLPRFTKEESEMLKGSMDFFGVNFYCGYWLKAPDVGSPSNVLFNVTYVGPEGQPPGEPSASFWLFKTPTGFRKTLVWLHQRYHGPEFWVTENGVSVQKENDNPKDQVLNDAYRVDYYSKYLDNMCLAVTEDGVNINTYFAWSLLDNFEWRAGFSQRFGIVYVDLDDNLRRTPKLSALWFAKHFFSIHKQAPLSGLVTQLRNTVAALFGSRR